MRKALLQIHLAVLLWGFTGVLGKAISLSAPILVWYRMLITSLFIAALLYFRKQWVVVDAGTKKMLIIIGCLIAMHWVAFYGAIKFANISIALICLSTASIFTSIIDPFVNAGKHNRYEILLGLLAIGGVYFIYCFQVHFGIGILFGIIAAVLSSVFTVLNKSIAGTFPVRIMVFYEMAAGWVFISLLLPFLFFAAPETNFFPNSTNLFGLDWYKNDWLWIAILSICCTVWAQSLALSALKKLSSFTTTLSVNLEPVYGILLAFLFYNENKEIIFINGTSQLNVGFIAGMSLIMLSVILQMLKILNPTK